MKFRPSIFVGKPYHKKMITLANFLVIVVVGLGISSMIWPARLPILLPVAVIVLGLMGYAR